MSRPSISVVVPAYNAERYVAETLQSILSQTLPPDEVVVVDDGSTDGTPDELMRFRGDVRVVRQPNQGEPAAYNTGFDLARGDYVARCDADDIWEPIKLERQCEVVQRHRQVDIAFAAARVFGDRDQPFSEFVGAPAPPHGLVDDIRCFGHALYRANMICASSVVMRRELHTRLGPLRSANAHGSAGEDWGFWLRATEAGAAFFYDSTVLVRYRRHGTSMSTNVCAMYDAAHVLHMRYRELAESPAAVRKALAADCFETALALFRDDKHDAARKALRSSLHYWPTAQRLAWAAVLSAPATHRSALSQSLRSTKARLKTVRSSHAPGEPVTVVDVV